MPCKAVLQRSSLYPKRLTPQAELVGLLEHHVMYWKGFELVGEDGMRGKKLIQSIRPVVVTP